MLPADPAEVAAEQEPEAPVFDSGVQDDQETAAETNSGLASLHDLTRADDIQVRPFDDDDGFFKDIETLETQPDYEAAQPADSTASADARADGTAIEEIDLRSTAEEQETEDEEAGTARATIAEPLDYVPEDANPPDRPRRLVPVESLLAGPAPGTGDRSATPPPASPRSEPTLRREATPETATDETPHTPGDAGARRPFRLDEPLDLSRQAPAPPPSSYPGGRRWVGYLLVALFFLALFIAGFWFTGTAQFRDLAGEAGKLWDQAVTSVKGVDLDEPAESSNTAGTTEPPTQAVVAPVAGNSTPEPAAAPSAPAPENPQPVTSGDASDTSGTEDSEQQLAALQPQTETPAPAPAVTPAPAPAATPAPAAPQSEVELLQAKAEAGDADAQYELGVRHRDGIGVEPNYSTAAEWFDRAAQQGHVPAQLGLGIMYRQGLGRARDLDLAKLWLHAAARAGDPDAQKLLGEVYVDETAGVPDYFQAARWFREAAEQGVVDAQYNMGVLYEGGLGVPRDFGQAYYWFSLAANAGDRSAPEDRERNAQLLTPEQRSQLDQKVAGFSPASAPAPAAPSANPAPSDDTAVLQRRDEIRVLQQLLISRGYDPGSPDGIPGAKTRQAIQAWQQDQGVTADGQVTRNVLESLKAGG